MKQKLLLLLLCVVQILQAQKTIKTEVKADNVIRQLEVGNQWAVPISQNETLPLKWQERTTTFTKKENIRTFVGYQEQTFVATLSILNGKVSGSLLWNGKDWFINTNSEGFITITQDKEENKDHHECGLCSEGDCKKVLPVSKITQKANAQQDFYIPPDVMLSDGVLRIYRLALLVSYEYYAYTFNKDINQVKAFWARSEAFLNELYTRDIGVRFELVADEKLIYKNQEDDSFYYQGAYSIVEKATEEINKLIGKESYDVGMVITQSHTSRVSGLASLGGVYEESTKGYALTRAVSSTIAHEMGHMFGSNHTFSWGGADTYYTETGSGQSVMSYGTHLPRDFFSLVSVLRIWRQLAKVGYYTDRERTQFVRGTGDVTNFPYGIKTTNTVPIINIEKLKKTYTIPKNTFFQFYIPATDKEQKELYYAAHQADISFFGPSNATFLTFKPTTNPHISFQTIYEGGFEKSYSKPQTIGEYTFWLSAYDANPQDKDHATLHDVFITKVVTVEGKPFKITSNIKQKYKAGEKVTLTWEVDDKVFDTNSKVRILMSDDFGKTFKYTLVASTENDGNCEITIPNIALGKEYNHGLGLIKVEVIDHIAHDITNYHPNGGGFEIETPEITFQNLPEQPTLYDINPNELPQVPQVIAISTCSTAQVPVKFEQKQNGDLITRSWTATDACNKSATFTQYIYIKEYQPLRFIGELPQNIEIFCEEELPSVPEIKVEGGCGTPKISYYDVKIDGSCRQTWKRVWIATSPCSEPIIFTQYIFVKDNKAPVFQEELPKDTTIASEYEMPYQIDLTAVDSCINLNVYVQKSEEKKYNDEGELAQVIYKWIAKDHCDNTVVHTQTITIKDRTLTTNEVDTERKKLYPNPTNGIFYLKGISDISQIKIYDISGKLVKQFHKVQSEYNISELNSGIYIVRVERNNSENKIFKIVKK